VGVEVGREVVVGVPEQFLHVVEGPAGSEQARCGRVPQVVEADVRQAGLRQCPVQGPAQRRLPAGPTAWPGCSVVICGK
jgi:hypothetical protein